MDAWRGRRTDLDVVTAIAGDVLKGKVIVGPDGEPLTGVLELTGNAADSQVLSGQTYYNTDAKTKRTGTMVNQGEKNASLNCGGSYTIPAGYHNGNGKITANSLASQTDSNAAAADIVKDKTAWVKGSKITGSMATMAGGTYTPTTSQQTISCNGKKMTSDVIVKGDANLVAGNIASGKSIFGVAGSAQLLKKYQSTSLTRSGSPRTFTGATINGKKAADVSLYYVTIPALDFTPVIAICSSWDNTWTSECFTSYYWGMGYVKDYGDPTVSSSSKPYYNLASTLSKSGFPLPVVSASMQGVGVIVYGY